MIFFLFSYILFDNLPKKKKNISKSLEKKKTAILKKFKAFKGKDDPSNKRKH